MDTKERQFLKTALLNYTRCLCTGDGYDLRVVFRIVQLWLRWVAGWLGGPDGDRRTCTFMACLLTCRVCIQRRLVCAMCIVRQLA